MTTHLQNYLMKDSNRGMGWGYYPIDVDYVGDNFRANVKPTQKRFLDFSKTYVLVGCEPETMYRPGTEPAELDFFWWDNSQLPHLRYPSPSNPRADKAWSRLTHRGWATPVLAPVHLSHRTRVNRKLNEFSGGVIQDISDLWGQTRDNSPVKNRNCLVIRSSDRNYREFYGTTWEQYWSKVQPVLDRWGYTYTVRSKVSPKARVGNQITDQIREGGFDCVLAHHSAGASEAVVSGTPVITTSAWNPARAVSTPWEQFAQTGGVEIFTREAIDRWVTQTCAYTYHRTELLNLSWIDVHPDATHLKEAKDAIYKTV